MSRLPRVSFGAEATMASRRSFRRKRGHRFRPWLQALEDRTVLSTITWNTTVAPTGGDWDTASNWVGGVVPGAGDDVSINVVQNPATVTLSSNVAHSVHSISVGYGAVLDIAAGSLNLGAGPSTIGGFLAIEPSASLTCAASTTLDVPRNSSIDDMGQLRFQAGDTVTIDGGMTVAGTLTAVGTTFTESPVAGLGIKVSNGGVITPTNCTINVPTVLPYNDVGALAGNLVLGTITINDGTLPAGSELHLNALGNGTQNTVYGFVNYFVLDPGSSLKVGPNVTVTSSFYFLASPLTTVSLSAGDVLNVGAGGFDGVLTATDTTFHSSSNAPLRIGPSGTIKPTNCTFDGPLIVPYSNMALLSDNVSFNQIEFQDGTIPAGGELDLSPIGTDTTNLSYVFPYDFTIDAGGTLKVAPNMSVLFQEVAEVGHQPLFTDNGVLSFAPGDNVVVGDAEEFLVGGSLTATGASFTLVNGSGGGLEVTAGGRLTGTGDSFSSVVISLLSGSIAALHFNTISNQLNIDSGATVNFSGNDLSALGTNGVVAIGSPSAHIPLEDNYWGTTDPTQIDAKIYGNNTDPTVPTVDFEPLWSKPGGTVASSAMAVFSPTDQTVNLTASVGTTTGSPITDGTEVFMVLSGTQVIGSPTSPVTVSNGSVTAPYTLPGNTPPGTYEIEATYSGDGTYPASTDATQLLTVLPLASEAAITSPPLGLIAGARGPVTLQLEDSKGNPAYSSQDQTINLATTSAGGAFYASSNSSSPITSIVIPAYQSNVTVYYADAHAGTPTLTANWAAAGSAATQSQTINPAAATHLVVTTTFASADPAGTTGSVTVTALDAYNNPVSSGPNEYAGTVDLTSTDGKIAGLPASYQFTAADAGSHTFTGVVLETAGSQAVQASDSASSTINGSATVNVIPAAASRILITSSALTLAAGARGQIVVQFEDAYANPGAAPAAPLTLSLGTTSAGGAFYATSSDPTAITQVVVPAGQSTETFDYADTLPGTPTLTVNAAADSSSVTQGETVVPAAATKLVVSTSFASPDTAGTAGTVTITATDPYGNVADSGPNQYLGTVDLSSTDPGAAGLPSTYTFTAGDHGTHQFSGVLLTTQGTQTVTATDSAIGKLTGTSAAVNVVPGLAVKLNIDVPANAVIAGKAFTVTVDALDEYGNTDPSYTGQVTLSLGSGSSGVLTGTLQTHAVAGVATFSNLVDTTSGSISLAARSGTLAPGTLNKVLISPGLADHFQLTTSFPNPDVAGTPGTVTITAYDANGNVDGSGPDQYLGTVDLSSADARIVGLPATYTFTGGDAGSHTFDGVILETAGNQAIHAEDSAINGISGGATVHVVPAAASAVEITTAPGTLVAGNRGPLVVALEDQYGNPGATSTNPVAVSLDTTSAGGAFYTNPDVVTTVSSLIIPAGESSAEGDYGDTVAGNAILTASAAGLSSQSTTVAVVPASVHELALTTSFANPDAAGTSGTVTITARDAFGNPVGSGRNPYLGTVDLASSDSRITGLPATYTFTALDAGTHTFTNVILATAGSQTITATDSATATLTAAATIHVVPGGADAVAITSPNLNIVAGGSGALVVQLEDAYGNLGATSTSAQPVTVTTTSAAGAFRSASTGSSPIDSLVIPAGQSRVTVDYSDTAAGTPTIAVSDTNFGSPSTQPVTVSPAAVQSFAVTTSFSGADPAGTVGTVTVTARDRYGNTAGSGPNSYTGTVLLNGTDPRQVGLPASRQFTASDRGTFTWTGVILKTAGSQAITATDSANGAIQGITTVDVTAAAANHLVITAPTSSPPTNGQPFTMVVSAEDPYGNVDSSFSGNVTISAPNEPGFPLTVPAVSGVATFPSITLNGAAGAAAIQVSSAGLMGAATSTVAVNSPSSPSPIIVSARVLILRGHGKHGKPAGKARLAGFVLTFGSPMNPATAGLAGNYQLVSTTRRRIKRKMVTVESPVRFTIGYNPATQSVTLGLIGKAPFKAGGQLTIVATPPGGVSSAAGSALDQADTAWKLAPKGTSITLV